MIGISELFTLNENFVVDLNKEWISTIREFKILLNRDKGSKGDATGKKKLQAQREFTLIYHYCDYRSQFVNYSEKDRRINALRNAELDTTLAIEKDVDLVAAIEAYRGLQETPAVKLLNELKEGIHTGYLVAQKVRKDLNKKLENLDIDEEDKEEKYEKINGKLVLVDPVMKIKERLEAIMDIYQKLPKTLESIKQQEEEVKRELANLPNLKGKAQKGEQEDPNQRDKIGNAFNLFGD